MTMYFLLRPDREAEYCDEPVRLSVCVCLSTIISSELYVRSSPKLFCVLTMAVTQCSSGGVVIRYVLPVLLMASYLPRLLDVAAPAKVLCTHNLGLGYKMCAVIPVAANGRAGLPRWHTTTVFGVRCYSMNMLV